MLLAYPIRDGACATTPTTTLTTTARTTTGSTARAVAERGAERVAIMRMDWTEKLKSGNYGRGSQ